ncbi:MAG: alpha/beta fold hydrolase [Pseudomonadota bacterium]
MIALTAAPALAAGRAITDQALAEELAQRPQAGESLWLEAGGGKFLAWNIPARLPERLGGVILVHDYGNHLDSQDGIGPLRRALADGRWQTLAVSLRLPAFDHSRPLDAHNFQAYVDQSLPRLTAAIDHLASQGIDKIALLGHGTGALVLTRYLDGGIPETQASRILALIALGMPAPDFLTETQQPKRFLAQSKLPILDIVSSRAAAPSLAAAKERQTAAAQAGNTRYRQLILAGAEPRLAGAEDTLAPRIKGWLQRQVNAAQNTTPEGEKQP